MNEDAEAIRTFALTWSEAWKQPELWRASLGEGELTAREVGQAYLRQITSPAEPREVFFRLVEEGAFAAADALLAYRPFIDSVGEAALEQSNAIGFLERRRTSAQLDFLGVWDRLLNRAGQVRLSIDERDSRALQAYCWTARNRSSPFTFLRELRERVEKAERSRTAELRNVYASRWNGLPSAPNVDVWRSAVERALERNDIAVAETLIDAGPDAAIGATTALPPPVLPMPRLGEPAELLRWSLSGAKAPRQFYDRWDVLQGGKGPRRLVEAHLRICEADHLTVEDVEIFVEELEKVIGGSGSGRVILAVEEGFETILCGLDDAASPAIDPIGLPLFVVPKNKTLAADRGPSRAPAMVFVVDPDVLPRRGDMLLTPYDLHHCLVTPEHTVYNLLRILCRQLPQERLLGPATVPGRWMHGWMPEHVAALRRRLVDGPQWLSGPSGIGKTALLHDLSESFERDGWQTSYVSRALDRPTIESHLATNAAPGLAVIVDDVEGLEDLDLLEAAIQLRSRLAIIVCSSNTLTSLLGIAHYRLPLMAFETLRAFAERVLDVSGYQSVDSTLLDRIAFHAAGRPALLYALLRALFHDLSDQGLPRAAGIPNDGLERAYRRKDFQSAARSVLLEPIGHLPRTNLVFGAVLVAIELAADSTNWQGTVPVDDVTEWLKSEGVVMLDDEILSELRTLADLELVHLDSAHDVLQLSRRGGGYTAMSLAGPTDAYFARAKDQFVLALGR